MQPTLDTTQRRVQSRRWRLTVTFMRGYNFDSTAVRRAFNYLLKINKVTVT